MGHSRHSRAGQGLGVHGASARRRDTLAKATDGKTGRSEKERVRARKADPSRSTEKSWPHFRPPPVDFCGSRLAIGAASERARALAMPAGTRAQALQTRANSSGG